MTPLSAPRIWLFLWWDVHNNFNPSSTEFDKSENQEEISIISNILIVILYSTKECLEGPKTAAYVNNKIKLSYRIINEVFFIPKLSSDWSVCDNLGSYWMRILLFCLWGQVEVKESLENRFFVQRNFLDITNISFHMNNIFFECPYPHDEQIFLCSHLFVLCHCHTQTNKTDASSITDNGNIERCRCSHPAPLRPPSSLCVKNLRSSKESVPEDSDVPHLPPGVVCRPRCLLAPNYPPPVTSWPRPQPGDPANGLTSGHQHQSLELLLLL